MRYRSSLSQEWRIGNGVRQGGVLSGLFFCLYIDSLIEEVSRSEVGCSLGIVRSHIIAYADDIVLIAPSAESLQILIDVAYSEANKLNLNFNHSKTKVMVFGKKGFKVDQPCNNSIVINNKAIEYVQTIKYLGYFLTYDLDESNDINKVKSKFYAEFNSILRKFSFTDRKIRLYLFKQYCTQFYGSELWLQKGTKVTVLKQLAVGFHNAVKRLLGMSTHESTHYACQEAQCLTFNHLLNKTKVNAIYRILLKPCDFIRKNLFHFMVSSVYLNEVNELFRNEYEIDYVFENDRDAVMARISFVQNHETQMRESC